MTTTTRRPARTATPARWHAALARAIADGIQVRQLAGSGAWIATSGSNATIAYQLQVTGEVAHGCDCPAAQHGDPICRHRAAFYALIGVLDPDPTPPAGPAAVAVIVLAETPAGCATCCGQGVEWSDVGAQQCGRCHGTGLAVAPAAPLTCPTCRGAGHHRSLMNSEAFCQRCRGSGVLGDAAPLTPAEITALTAFRATVTRDTACGGQKCH